MPGDFNNRSLDIRMVVRFMPGTGNILIKSKLYVIFFCANCFFITETCRKIENRELEMLIFYLLDHAEHERKQWWRSVETFLASDSCLKPIPSKNSLQSGVNVRTREHCF